MPKQKGVFNINGTIDDTTFYEGKGVFLARRASKVSTKPKMLTSPCYTRTRPNSRQPYVWSLQPKSTTLPMLSLKKALL